MKEEILKQQQQKNQDNPSSRPDLKDLKTNLQFQSHHNLISNNQLSQVNLG